MTKLNKKYYIYHIPGKKIGVTSNLYIRVTKQQGYASDEYEVLLTSDDIDFISQKEIELQKSYGYKVDRQSYKNLINKNNEMKLNVTEQTTTFPMPVNKLKGNLMDNMGIKWDTDHGVFGLDDQTIEWICKNAKVSMFNVNRCYIYNKAYASEFLESKVEEQSDTNVYDLIRDWATEKGIYKSGDARTQYVKLMEEAGELAQAILKNDEPEVIDAIGDMVVVLTNLAKLRGHNIEDCITSAYDVIKSRTGKMVDGTFVKSENLKETL
jgi:NTP pyrophosphatase (non-canonical NTP hydrolase)